MVENYDNPFVREFLAVNFSIMFTQNHSIPIGILIEPFIKQLRVAPRLTVNVWDFELFAVLAQHPKLYLKNAIQVLDALLKIYASDHRFSNAAYEPLMIIAERFQGENLVTEFLYRASKYAVQMVSDYEVKAGKGLLGKRNRLLSLLEAIVILGDSGLNGRIQEEVLIANVTLKRLRGVDHKGLVTILHHLGDPGELIAAF